MENNNNYKKGLDFGCFIIERDKSLCLVDEEIFKDCVNNLDRMRTLLKIEKGRFVQICTINNDWCAFSEMVNVNNTVDINNEANLMRRKLLKESGGLTEQQIEDDDVKFIGDVLFVRKIICDNV